MATSAKSSSDLLAALYGNDLALLKKILQSGVDPNINRGQRSSLIPLLVAAWNGKGKLKMMQCLLLFKADANIVDNDGSTALHWAACNGRADAVELLMSNGADVNKQGTARCWTALHRACCYGHVSCVQILLEHGANVALRDDDGKTARDKAVERKQPEVVQLLDDFVFSRAKGLPSMCDSMTGELSDLKEKQSELDSVKAELESLKAEMKQLTAMNAKMAQLLASKAELDQLSTLKTEVAQLKAEVARLSTLKAEEDQFSTLKTEVAQLSTLKTEVNQLSSLKIEVAQLSASKADVGQLLTLKTTMEQHANDLSSLVEELFPKEDQPQPTPSIDIQLRSISRRQDVEDNWWNVGKELGFSSRHMKEFAAKCDTNDDDTMQPAILKMLQTWCGNNNWNTDEEKMREICRILEKFGVRDEE